MKHAEHPVAAKPELGTRSPHWPAVRKAHLAAHPKCEACGGAAHLEVHHVEPFHLEPDLELVDANLITLCESPGHNCHFVFGHLLDWKSFNAGVHRDAAAYRRKVTQRPELKIAAAAVLLAVLILGSLGASAQAPADAGPPVEATAMVEGGPVSPDGSEEVAVDLPAELRLKNTGGIGPRGPGTGAGLCVFTSTEHCGRWQNMRDLFGFQQKMTREPGGGDPDKVVAMLKKYAPASVNDLLQITNGDAEWLKAALKSGRFVGMTYAGHDPRYGQNTTIAHMVNPVHLSAKWGAILDNNYPSKYLWMPAQDLVDRWRGETSSGKKFMISDGFRQVPIGGGWALTFTTPPPPPVPKVSTP